MNTITYNARGRFLYDPRYRLVTSTGKRHTNATDGVDAPVSPAPAATDYVEKTAGYTKVILHLQGPAGRCAQVERLATGTDSTSLPVFHVHGDHLGSGQALTKADGTLLCQEEFFAYGRSSDRRDTRNRYRFIGVERDEDTGLCMTGPRTYDPIVGRFLQGDPLTNRGPYVYCSGSPTTASDAGGYQPDPVATLPTSMSAPTTSTPDGDLELIPEIMQTAEKVLATIVPEDHLKAIGAAASDVERGAWLYRSAQGHYKIGDVVFGNAPRKSPQGTVYSVDTTGVGTFIDIQSDGSEEVFEPYIFVHTHPDGNPVASIADLRSLSRGSAIDRGILSIGSNDVIPSLGLADEPVPFMLAIRGPEKYYNPSGLLSESVLESPKAVKAALHAIFGRRTEVEVFTGTIGSGNQVVPYRSRRELRK